MVRILLIIVIALAVVIGLMQLARHQSEATPNPAALHSPSAAEEGPTAPADDAAAAPADTADPTAALASEPPVAQPKDAPKTELKVESTGQSAAAPKAAPQKLDVAVAPPTEPRVKPAAKPKRTELQPIVDGPTPPPRLTVGAAPAVEAAKPVKAQDAAAEPRRFDPYVLQHQIPAGDGAAAPSADDTTPSSPPAADKATADVPAGENPQ